MVLMASFATMAQTVIPRQKVSYNVNYKWGVIDVNIASGIVEVESDGSNFYGTLDGTSIPWEGRIICVDDTLRATMSRSGDRLSERVEYQNGWYRRPYAAAFRSSSYNPDEPAFCRSIAGQGSYDASDDSMEAIAVTSDMLGMYYFAHAIDFGAMQPGSSLTIPIEGGYSNSVVITYHGEGEYSTWGFRTPTYNITFEYAYEGHMSGYPVECRIGQRDRIPVFISASLPVGRVEMLYNP